MFASGLETAPPPPPLPPLPPAGRNCVPLTCPLTKVDQFAALTAERTILFFRGPLDLFFARWTFNFHGHLRLIAGTTDEAVQADCTRLQDHLNYLMHRLLSATALSGASALQ